MNNINQLFEIIAKLKDTERDGWLKRQVSKPESVADHSLGLAILTTLLCPDHLNRDKCLLLAVFHDIQEAITGDINITYATEEQKAQKHQLELEAITKISADLDAPWLIDLFNELAENKTPEAQFVSSLDKYEACLQAKYYSENNRTHLPVCEEFKQNALKNPKVKDKTIKNLLKDL